MKRTQIQLTDEQYKLLKSISTQRDVSMAEIIRESINNYTAGINVMSDDKKYKKVQEVIGKFSSGKKDISVRHDYYLGQDYK